MLAVEPLEPVSDRYSKKKREESITEHQALRLGLLRP
jgi:hypothetical protein